MTTIAEFKLLAENPSAEDSATPQTRSDLIAAFQENKDRLIRLIGMRLDRRLAGRIDPSDILQDTFLRADAAFEEYVRLSEMPVYNWLRVQAQFAVGDCHRTHLGTLKRAASMEEPTNNSDSDPGLEALAESMISPASKVANADLAAKVRELITEMDPRDRDILVLRHVEELSIAEAAAELGITTDAAKKRHLRAVRRLQDLCRGLNGSSAG